MKFFNLDFNDNVKTDYTFVNTRLLGSFMFTYLFQ